MATIRVRAGHVQPIWAGHPWVFAQAIATVDGAPAAGDAVDVVDPRGQRLGSGYWSPSSAIPVRILSREGHGALDDAWLGRRIERAARWRLELLGLPSEQTTGFRLVHAEGDGLAGLVVDVCGDVAAVQLLTAGMKRRQDAIFSHVARVTGARTVIEVANPRSAKLEGFEADDRVVRGPDVEVLRFRERGFEYEVPWELAQKTGFYFDQRENRERLEALARGREVLDAFCYVGGFSLAAARGGASSVLGIDSSAPVVATAAAIARANDLTPPTRFTRGDLKKSLAQLARDGRRFDIVVVDPPKLVPGAKHVQAGRRAYRRINAEALRLVTPGGVLVTCSCSAAMTPSMLMRTVAFAARDASRSVDVLWQARQGPDHPTPAAFPEGRYLKCFMLRVEDGAGAARR